MPATDSDAGTTAVQAQVTQHANTVAESYVTIEQLKDVDSRSLSRSAAATANCEERMTSAATAAVRAASDQAQARMESLRDRIQAEIASVQAMVGSLQYSLFALPLKIVLCVLEAASHLILYIL